MSIVLNGTTGITTPDVNSDGLTVDSTTLVVDEANNRVGIGTSSPSSRLDLAGGVLTTRGGEIRANNTGSAATLTLTGGNAFAGGSGAGIAIRGYTVGYNNGGMEFYYGNGTTTLEAARIDSSGNLLKGTTSATGRITQYTISAVGWNFASVTTGAGAGLYGGWSGSTQVWLVYGNGSSYNATGTWGALSDIKLKENIVDTSPKLENLLKVRVVNYNLKTTPAEKHIGVIAQEIEQIFPAMVEEVKDVNSDGVDIGTTTKTVKYSVFVPMLIKAIQEQQAIIDEQKTALEALTARVSALEAANV